MKNVAHFASGLALASFVPGVIEDAARGSLLIALGGACAMLPDTLDFRLARYLEKRNADIAPDRTQPDPQVIAAQIAVQMLLAVSEQRPRIVQLHPTRQSVVDWVLYTLRFDVAQGDVVITMDQDGHEGRAHVGRIDYTYEGNLHIEELGGPSLRFSASANGVRIEFLPWHRLWTHSLVIALALGLLFALVLEPRAGIVAALGYGIHVVEDELGYMGSNLLAPLTRGRGSGLRLWHSGETLPNVTTVWLSLSLLLLNMDHVRSLPLISTGPYLAFAVALPCGLMAAIYARRRWRKHVAHEEALEAQRQHDVVADAEDAQG